MPRSFRRHRWPALPVRPYLVDARREREQHTSLVALSDRCYSPSSSGSTSRRRGIPIFLRARGDRGDFCFGDVAGVHARDPPAGLVHLEHERGRGGFGHVENWVRTSNHEPFGREVVVVKDDAVAPRLLNFPHRGDREISLGSGPALVGGLSPCGDSKSGNAVLDTPCPSSGSSIGSSPLNRARVRARPRSGGNYARAPIETSMRGVVPGAASDPGAVESSEEEHPPRAGPSGRRRLRRRMR